MNNKDLQKALKELELQYYSDSANFDNYDSLEDYVYENLDLYFEV